MHQGSRSVSDQADNVGGGVKRSFEKAAGDGFEVMGSDEKRQKLPGLASVVLEAVKMDSLQKLFSNLEPILRRVVGEEVERALAKLVPHKIPSKVPPRQLQESPPSDLRLIFRNKLSLPLFTGGKVEGEQGLPIHVVLNDASTGRVVTTGPESAAKLEVVVLDGDFANDEDEWTAEDFENHVVKERDGKRPLLTGDLSINLKEGVGTLGDLMFTDNSSWIRSRKFRLGVRVIPGSLGDIRIQECKTEAFTVKDHRGELYKKHYPPALSDEVWRLDKIGKDGAFHKRLKDHGITTVEGFLRNYVMDQQKLRNILGSGMSNRMWDATVEHAKTCVLSGKLYVFYADDTHNIGVIFNNIYELMGVTFSGQYKSAEALQENEKVYVDKLVKVAYENWHNVTEYESGSYVSEQVFKHDNIYDNANIGNTSKLKEQPLLYENSLSPQSENLQSSPTVANAAVGGLTSQLYDFNTEVQSRFGSHGNHNDQMLTAAANMHNALSSSDVPFQGSFAGNDASVTSLALGPSQFTKSFPFQHTVMSQQPYQTNSLELQRIPTIHEPYFMEEEDIRAKAQEMLGNDDMQQLLRYPYGSLQDNFRLQGEDAYIPGFSPSPAVSDAEGTTRSSGKAYVGWLKLKAALRWGIFIRKIVQNKAVKKAQIEELED